jgi:adenosylcobinamide kinase/adenosylcobinamide-phosphate guanylyltransferase
LEKTTPLSLGGARSGKSRYAQQLVEACGPPHVFIATAEALDDEMSERIARHVADRGTAWQTIDAPISLYDAIEQACSERHSVLVDCLTLWLSNIMQAGLDVGEEVQKLARSVEAVTTPLVLVSNEVGMGIVPESPLGRQFRDEQGRLNQVIAAACDRVEFVAAGLPLGLK